MQKKYRQNKIYFHGSFFVVAFFVMTVGVNYVWAFVEPTVTAPGGNVPAPVTAGSPGQAKEGPLILNTDGTAVEGLVVDNGEFEVRDGEASFSNGTYSDPDSGNAYDAKFGGSNRGIVVRGISYLLGALGIGDSTPDTDLLLDVEGKIGATEYCDENGANCITAGSFGVAQAIDDLTDGKSDNSSVFLGLNAGAVDDRTANQNVGIGRNALDSSVTGLYNTAVGYLALSSNTTNNNTAVGRQALRLTTTGASNTAVGRDALELNTTGSSGVAVGLQALERNTSGYSNVAVGRGALLRNTTGIYNVAMGHAALDNNIVGSRNLGIGYHALGNSTGSNNIAIGYGAGDSQTAGAKNIIIGYAADAPNLTGSNQLNIGNLIYGTGLEGVNSTVSTGNIGIGTQAPLEKLHVEGDALIAGDTSAPRLTIGQDSVFGGDDGALHIMGGLNGGNIFMGDEANESQYGIRANRTGRNLSFFTGSNGSDGTARMRISSGGDVSIGDGWGSVVDPNLQAQLVVGDSNPTMLLGGFENISTNFGLMLDGGVESATFSSISTLSGTTPKDLILQDISGQNVGIGDTTPDAGLKLDVEGQIGATEYCDENGANCVSVGSLGAANTLDEVTTAGNTTTNDISVGTTTIGANEKLDFANYAGVDDHISLYGSGATGYGVGVESSTLYNRSNGYHRWYISELADGGVSENMELDGNSLNFNGKNAIQYSDSWLRLNSGNAFSNGTYTPGMLRADGGFQVDGETVVSTSGAIISARYPNDTRYGYFEGRNDTGDRGFYLGNGDGGSRVDFAIDTADTLSIFGGDVGIGDSTPDASLVLDVEGQIGATEYCDENGANCTSAGALGGDNLGNHLATQDLNMGGNDIIGIQSASFVNEEQTSVPGVAGEIYFDENFFPDYPEFASNGGGLSINSEDGWGAFYTTSNDNFATPNFAGLRVSAEVGIGDSTPDGTLLLDVEGQVGATEYCDENGANCIAAGSLSGVSAIDDLSDGKSDDVNSVFLGAGAGAGDDGSANNNTGIGITALGATTTGSNNTGIGYRALVTNVTGSNNTAIGRSVLANSTGSNNTGIGNLALNVVTTGTQNTAIGAAAGDAISTGSYNTVLGYNALSTVSTSSSSTAIGRESLRLSTGGSNTALGYQTLEQNTTGVNNTAIGVNTMIANSTGSNNVAVGRDALGSTVSSAGSTAIGESALQNSTGQFNTAVGRFAGDGITTGTQNIVIGYGTDVQSPTASNQLSIGNLIYGIGLDATGASVSSGNIGIGTRTPARRLSVASGISASDPAYLRVQSAQEASTNPGDVYAGIELGVVGGENGSGSQEVTASITAVDTRSGFTSFEDGGLAFNTLNNLTAGPETRMTITGTGDVGIGDISPDATLTLDVEGQIGATEYCDENGANCTPAGSLGGTPSLDVVTTEGNATTNDISVGTTTIGANEKLDFANYTSTDDHVSLYGTGTNGYGFGVEGSTLYNRSNGMHRWYISELANGGASENMELDSDSLNFNNKSAIQYSDSWLRLNPSSQFTSGTYTPNRIRADAGFQVDSKSVINGTGSVFSAQYPNDTRYGYFEARNHSGSRGFYLGNGNGGNTVDFNLDAADILNISGGDVGIGTSTPNAQLDVDGNAHIGSGTGNAVLTIGRDSIFPGGDPSIEFAGVLNRATINMGSDANPSEFSIAAHRTCNKLLFQTGSLALPRLSIDNDGSVGVGQFPCTGVAHEDFFVSGREANGQTTVAFGQQLGLDRHVSGIEFHTISDTSPYARINAVDNNAVGVDQGKDLVFQGGAIGDVGIGITAPTEKLDLNGNLKMQANDYIAITNGSPATGQGGYFQGTAQAGATAGYGAWVNYNAFWNGTNFIQPRGTLGSKLFTSNHHYGGWSWLQAPAGGTNGNAVTLTEVANLTTAGNFEITGAGSQPGGGSWTNSSDIRLKDVGAKYTDGLSEILQLNPVRFKYKVDNERGLPDDKEHIGFIAQEVREVVPDAVSEGEDGFLDFNMHAINVAIVNALKEISARVNDLFDRVTSQQQEIDALKEKVERQELLVEKATERLRSVEKSLREVE